MFHNIQQNSEEWYKKRVGKMTSSNLAKIMANFGKPFGEPAKKYAIEIAVGQLTGQVSKSNYSNEHMERGHEEEPIARILYENQYFCSVLNGGFFELDDIGCSPDGLVGDNGLIEIKSAIPSIHYSRIVKQSFDPAYKWQLVGNLKFIEREWIDFISYCADFPEDKRLYVYRCHAEDFKNEFKMVDERIDELRELIGTAKKNIMSCNYSLMDKVKP